MPKEIVHIDLSTETGARPQPTYTDVGIVGTMTSSPPNAGFGEVNRYTSAADVSNDYGDGTPVHTSSQALAEMGASYWYVLVLEATEQSETLTDGTDLPNGPVLGEQEISIDSADIGFTTESPPVQDQDTAATVINTDTLEVATSETDPELTYYTADFTGLDVMSPTINRVGAADIRATERDIGTLNALQSWASSNDAGMITGGPNVSTFADVETAMDTAHAVSGYLPSGGHAMLVNNNSEDLAAYLLGRLATSDPWHNFYWDELPVGGAVSTKIGDPATADTFEGGDTDNSGPLNVIINKGGTTIVSNSLTTAGNSSDYQFFDVRQTAVFIRAEVRRILESLRIRRDRIPFTSDGRDIILNVISDTLQEYVGGTGNPLSAASTTVPEVASLSDTDKANREWTGIELDITLAGDVHEFTLGLTVGV